MKTKDIMKKLLLYLNTKQQLKKKQLKKTQLKKTQLKK